MFYVVHILMGGVIAKFFPSIAPIVILGLISHFLIDMIPHRDTFFTKNILKKSYKLKFNSKEVLFEATEIIISILVIIYIQFKFKSSLMLFAIFISLLPDLVKFSYLTRLRNNKIFIKYFNFHFNIQREASWPIGILTQLIATIILIMILF